MKFAFCLFAILVAPLISAASYEGSVLDEINLARTHPHEYAIALEGLMSEVHGVDGRCVAEAAAFLKRQRPLEPLQTAQGLAMSARQHVNEQGASGEIGHRGMDGSSPFARMAKWGQWTGRAGENISYGYADPRIIVATLIVDQGVPDRGHRRNIFCADYRYAGVACGAHARYGAMCVIDFAGGFAEKGEKVAVADAWRGVGE
jgi:uncharacterized protein YkwD